MRYRLVAFLALTGSLVHAQSNAIPGLGGRLTDLGTPNNYGRRGPAHPNGEVAMCYSYTMCNNGLIVMPWLSTNSNPMAMQHPMFAFMIVREAGGRMIQISNDAAYVKHGYAAANSNSVCGPCQHPGTSAAVGINCADTYGSNTNANRFWLGPRQEIDPWTGLWDPIGSYFDQGDPNIGPPNNTNGIRSLTSGNFADPVKNRIALKESDLLAGGRYFYYMHMVVEGESGAEHGDNLGYREMSPSWNGSNWNWPAVSSFTNGSVLEQWQGATVSQASNGTEEGSFFVAVSVTGPTAGLYHYEYAVHNFDNSRAGARLRVPVCPSSTVTNIGFRDIDGIALTDWSASRVGDELHFSAPLGNALEWNQLFNFWFDCDVAPVNGYASIDQALPGPGQLAVSVATQIPGGSAAITDLGSGCGVPRPVLTASELPTIPSQGFGFQMLAMPASGILLVQGLGTASVPLAPGCLQYVDNSSAQLFAVAVTDAAGIANVSVPVPNLPQFDGLVMSWQAAQLVTGGPVLGELTLSNGVATTLGCR